MVNVLWAQPGDDPAFDVIEGGTLIADQGFRATYNGFGFPNYGNESGFTNLTPADIVYLFGEEVCAGPIDEFGECELIPNAQLYLEEVNQVMDGGHCEGMAVLSTLFYGGVLNPVDYGAEFVPDLMIEDNEFLQREIAYWFVMQGLSPTADSTINGTPTEIVQYLVDNSNSGELFTLGFYAADYTGGHAVTYYGVVDMGDGIYRILLYDNNYPFEERFIEVDANTDTWVYTGATIPTEEAGLYYGDAETQTLSVIPVSARLEPQVCPFCGDALSMKPGEFSSNQYSSLSVNGRALPLVTDANGNQTGYVNGRYVNNIPGAKINHAKNLGLSAFRAPEIYIPLGVEYTLQLLPNPNNPDDPASSITVTQTGKVTIISGFDVTTAEAYIEVTVDGVSFSSPGEPQALTYRQAISAQNGEDYLLTLNGTSDSVEFYIDPVSGEFSVLGGEGDDSFTLSGERYDENGNIETFDAIEIPNSPDEFFSSDPESWTDEITEAEDAGFEEDGGETDSGEGDESAEDDSGDGDEGDGDESAEDDSGDGDEGDGDESAEDDSGYGDDGSEDDSSTDEGGEG
jgi:hypothetical protein